MLLQFSYNINFDQWPCSLKEAVLILISALTCEGQYEFSSVPSVYV
jgi:hypothetical protein